MWSRRKSRDQLKRRARQASDVSCKVKATTCKLELAAGRMRAEMHVKMLMMASDVGLMKLHFHADRQWKCSSMAAQAHLLAHQVEALAASEMVNYGLRYSVTSRHTTPPYLTIWPPRRGGVVGIAAWLRSESSSARVTSSGQSASLRYTHGSHVEGHPSNDRERERAHWPAAALKRAHALARFHCLLLQR